MNTELETNSGRSLGIDYGERRIGFAVSDRDGIIATPLQVVSVSGDREAVRAAAAICLEQEAVRIIVGLPLNMDGSSGPMAEKAKLFAGKVADAAGVEVILLDERLSTAMVERTLLQADMSRARRKTVRDKLAAQVILQSYLDSKAPIDYPEA